MENDLFVKYDSLCYTTFLNIRHLTADANRIVLKNVDWNKFDQKWTNVQSYFDDNGVKDDENQCVLLRTLISYFNEMNNFTALYYVNFKEYWRDKILLNNLQDFQYIFNYF